jgi:hypothetical protein
MHSIRQIKQVFPEELAEQVYGFVAGAPYQYGWPSNKNIGYSHWNYTIAPGDAHNGLEIAHTLPPLIAQAWDHIQQNYIGEQTLIRCYTNAHTFGVEGYPHTDSEREHDKTIVVYMNHNWRREWGGETMIYNGYDIVHAELPKFNKGLIFNGNQFHTARSVSRICPKLRRTLMFKFAPKNIDPVRDRIQTFLEHMGTRNVKHSSRGPLFTHLIKTYDILKKEGCPEAVCAAGGLHSIFGTNIFKKQTLSLDDKAIIGNLVGDHALELIELFCTLKRPDTLINAIKKSTHDVETVDGRTITLTPSQLKNLCLIEAANLHEQSSKYSNMHEAWRDQLK